MLNVVVALIGPAGFAVCGLRQIFRRDPVFGLWIICGALVLVYFVAMTLFRMN